MAAQTSPPTSSPTSTPAAVLLDLDDTLYPQAAFLDGAWEAVADAGAALGIDRSSLRRALDIVAAQGSDRGRIIDRAVVLADGPSDAVPVLVAAFAAHRPTWLPPYPGVPEAIERLAAVARLAVVTDGRPDQQRAKLAATGLGRHVEVVVVTDDAGRELRKPHPHGFVAALDQLGVAPEEAVVVGDRVDKDVEGALRLGIRAVRVRQGEHRSTPTPPGVLEVPDTPSAVEALLRSVPAGAIATAGRTVS